MRVLFALVLAVFAVSLRVPEKIGDLGFMLGVEEECTDFFCQAAHLSILNYTFPPPAEHKGTILVNVTADYPGSTTMFIGRTTAYDFNTGRYFLLTQMGGVGGFIYTLYTIQLKKSPIVVTYAEMTAAEKLEVSSMQWDSVDKILYAVFDTDMYTVDPVSGNITMVGPLTTQPEVEPSLTTCYDSNTHNYWIAVYDDLNGIHLLMTYNTRTKMSTLTPNLNNGDYWTLYGIQYYAKNDTILALTQNNRGYPSIKIVNYITGTHVDLIPEWIWGDYEPDYLLWPVSDITNGIVWVDPMLNIFWITVQYYDPETLAFDDALVYYNLTKGGIELGSGPMVIWENAIEFTNYVWYNWDTPF